MLETEPVRGTSEIIKIPKYEDKLLTILDRTTVLYGGTASGKTTMAKHLMWIMKEYFPIVYAFNPEEADNHSYEGIVPKQLIFEKLDPKFFFDLCKKQKLATQIYKQANKLQDLSSLFEKCASQNELTQKQSMQKCYQQTQKSINTKWT